MAVQRTPPADERRIPDDLASLAVPIDDLASYHRNARTHDLPTIQMSLRVNGQYRPIVVNRGTLTGRPNEILAGNGTVEAARAEGWTHVAATFVDVDDHDAARIVLVDNRANDLAGYDDTLLADLLASLPDLEGTGYDQATFAALMATSEDPIALTDPDHVPTVPAQPVTKLGDVWLLGPHRLLCGDSTSPDDVRTVTAGATVSLIHADPPYGMGKEADGVLNDNLYREALDAFQMAWWRAWLPVTADNGSAYIWGTAPDLWRLWYVGGLGADPNLTLRNEIVWDKGSGMGMRSAGHHSYPTATERCLFVMRGEQFLGNQNKEDFWEGYEPLRAWLEAERDKVGWTNRDVNTFTGTQMAGHWFTRSQFMPISGKHYRTLQEAAAGRAFTRDYDELFAELFPDARDGGNAHRRELAAQLRESRSYFDNAHDSMTDVWPFLRVTGEERQGHATPKPVAMVERAFKSSTAPGDVVGVPFGGSGPDFIAAHRLGRVAVGMELDPGYVDVICRRYQEHTGTLPVLEATGLPRDFTAPADA